jgi:NADH-quinone oxidoreductase subunit L
MVWMVFFGRRSVEAGEHSSHLHDAGLAMRVALAPLAAGTALTWLLAGPFARMLEKTLPFHHLEAESTWGLVLEVVTAPATLLALAVVAIGLAAWQRRDLLAGLVKHLGALRFAAVESFGFEWLNQRVVDLTRRSAASLRVFQTGQLNWNLVGILAGLALVLTLLAIGA